MKILASSAAPLQLTTPLLILPIFADSSLEGTAAALDQELGGLLTETVELDGFKAAVGDSRIIPTPNGATKRVLLLGLGKKKSFLPTSYAKPLRKPLKTLAP